MVLGVKDRFWATGKLGAAGRLDAIGKLGAIGRLGTIGRPGRASLILGAAGVAVAALGYAHHDRRQPELVRTAQSAAPVQSGEVWTGQLAVAPVTGPVPATLSSASLVVPKEQLALPPAPPKPKPRIKAACDSADSSCLPRPAPGQMAALPVPPSGVAAPRKMAASDDKVPVAGVLPVRPPGLIPEPAAGGAPPVKSGHSAILASIGRPFAAIGHTVKSWFNWL